MAEQSAPSPIRPEESATTREEMDFDDNEQESGTISPLGHETPTKAPAKLTPERPRVSFQDNAEEIPPVKPPRPVSPMRQAEHTLIEAFPSIDAKVVKAVLVASGGKVEPAFNALLGMSDPDFNVEDAHPPPPPPRPAQKQPLSQMEADELYARQLAEQYNGAGQQRNPQYNQRGYGGQGYHQQGSFYEEERERNFFDDDLPEIGKNIQQGFIDTQKKVNSWISNFKKRLDGDGAEEEEDLYSASQPSSRQSSSKWQGRQNFGASQSEQLYGIQKAAEAQRKSTDGQQAYDADPRELREDEFQRLELRDDEAPPPQPPRNSSRKSANPDLFKPQPKPPQSGPVDEVDAAARRGGADGEKSKKWQPLTSVAPHPEDDNDPFSLGDDDDDKDKTDDVRKDDTDRLKESARNSISGSSGPALQEAEKSGPDGTRNKEAEELLTRKKA